MDLIEERKKWLENHFFVRTEVTKKAKNMNIVRRRNYLGLYRDSGEIILPTVFDEIELVESYGSPRIAIASIGSRYAFFDLNEREKWIIKQLFDSYNIDDYFRSIEIISDGKHGLIDIDDANLVVFPSYDAVSKISKLEYIWVKQRGLYHYIVRDTGKLLLMPGAVYAYDYITCIHWEYDLYEGVMFIKKENGIVESVNENGLPTDRLRLEVLSNAGRLHLSNSQDHKLDVIDIYGRILN